MSTSSHTPVVRCEQPSASGERRRATAPSPLAPAATAPADWSARALATGTAREQAALCSHRWRWARPAEVEPDGCERPSLIICERCPSWFVRSCGSARSVRCGTCARLKRGDVASIGRSGWSSRAGAGALLVTLTAPGADVLPWDTAACTHHPTVACAGAIGCRVQALPAAAWHATLPLRWSHFVTETRRSLNPGLSGSPSCWPVRVEFFKTYEPQRRQALHIHAMIRYEGVVTLRRVVAALSKARRLNGFGPQMDVKLVDIGDAERAARTAGYVAKYCSKSADELPNLRRLDIATGEVTQGGLRAWSASRQWGDSMAATVARRRAYAAARARADALGSMPVAADVSAALDSYQQIYASASAPMQRDGPPDT